MLGLSYVGNEGLPDSSPRHFSPLCYVFCSLAEFQLVWDIEEKA